MSTDKFLSFEEIFSRLIIEAYKLQLRANINNNPKSETLLVQNLKTKFNTRIIRDKESYIFYKESHHFLRGQDIIRTLHVDGNT